MPPPHRVEVSSTASPLTPLNNAAISAVPTSSASVRDLNFRLDRIVRCTVAAKFEGDMCLHLKEAFGARFQRGEETSSLDGGLLLVDDDDDDADSIMESVNRNKTKEILGIDIKTAIMCEAWYNRGTNQSELAWEARISSQSRQLTCDVFLVGWPLLRQRDYWTVKTGGFDTTAGRKYALSGLCTFIEPVVPPELWPLTVPRTDIMTLLEAKRVRKGEERRRAFQGEVSTDLKADHISELDEYTTRDLLNNSVDSCNYRNLVIHLHASLLHTQDPKIRVYDTRYQPYTADLFFEINDDLRFFVEVKFARATLLDDTKDKDGMVRVRHLTRLSLYGRSAVEVLIPTGGRYSFLASEVSKVSQRTKVKGRMVPRLMMILSRDEIASIESGNVLEAEEVILKIPSKNIVDLRGDVAAQLTSIFYVTYRDQLHLPGLENLKELSDNQIAIAAAAGHQKDSWLELGGEELRLEGADRQRDLTADNLRQTHVYQRQYQGRWSLRVLQECYRQRSGLIFDFESYPYFRQYAFSLYNWSDRDVDFVRSRPHCSPREMFTLPSNSVFAMLSFGIIRCRSQDLVRLVHPFVNRRLREEAKNDSPAHHRGIIVLSGKDEIAEPRREAPLYAIPSTAIHHDDPNRQIVNHNSWQNLELRDRLDIDAFRFESLTELIIYLVGMVEEALLRQSKTFNFRGESVQLTTRENIFEEILPGFKNQITMEDRVNEVKIQ